MFRCVECGCEYEVKPEYCDCGNDTFEQVKESKPEIKPSININSVPKEKIIKKESISYSSKQDGHIYNSKISQSKKVKDLPSLIIFIGCVLLALVVVLFIGNPEPKTGKTTIQPEKTSQETVNLPTVESYWDNSTEGVIIEKKEAPVVVQQIQVQEPPRVEQPKDPMTLKFEQWLNSPKKADLSSSQRPVVVQKTPISNQSVQKPTPAVKQTGKTQTKQSTTINSSSPKINSPGAPNDLLARIQKNIQYTNTTTQTKTAAPQKTIQNQNTTTQTVQQGINTTPTKQKVSTTTPSQTQAAPTLRNATYQNVKSQAELKQELSNYKISLRNAIGKKINFANVVGDGNCAITFKVDSTGKLINRNFSQQSSNVTLNDAVYKAMLSTAQYNKPPEGYKNETMTLKVKVYDGNYEINLY